MKNIDFLFIDDDPAVCKVAKRIAESCGFLAAATTDADEFKQIYRNSSVAVIAVDLSMPQIDGVEVFRFLAKTNCQAGILIVSGFDRRVVEAASRLGKELGLKIVGTISKPLALEDFRSILSRSIETQHILVDDDRFEITAASFKEAVSGGELTLAFQPKIELITGRLTGVEALARWQHPKFGEIAPSLFVPRAEQLRIIDWFTEWVIDTALGQWARWRKLGIILDIAINISPLSLDRLDLPDLLSARCKAFGVPARYVVVELTEGTTQSAVRLLDAVSRFRLKGMKISLDDYGTGYSSLAQLQQLPFTEIKIDRRFVENCDALPESRAILKSTIDLGHELGLAVTAEGVETQSVLDLLVELGCDQAQGYFIARPMPGADLPMWAAERRAPSH